MPPRVETCKRYLHPLKDLLHTGTQNARMNPENAGMNPDMVLLENKYLKEDALTLQFERCQEN